MAGLRGLSTAVNSSKRYGTLTMVDTDRTAPRSGLMGSFRSGRKKESRFFYDRGRWGGGRQRASLAAAMATYASGGVIDASTPFSACVLKWSRPFRASGCSIVRSRSPADKVQRCPKGLPRATQITAESRIRNSGMSVTRKIMPIPRYVVASPARRTPHAQVAGPTSSPRNTTPPKSQGLRKEITTRVPATPKPDILSSSTRVKPSHCHQRAGREPGKGQSRKAIKAKGQWDH